MPDRELIIEILRQIEESAEKIITRFKAIHDVSDFTDSSAGVEKMDAICMMLIVIGESLKKLDAITGGELLSRYPEVGWKKAKGMRDIITHHYADVDAEAIFTTCKENIPPLLETVRKIKSDQA